MSLVHRVFKSQMENRTKKDWVTTVLMDLQLLGMSNISMEEIRNMKKSVWIKMIKKRIIMKTLEFLENLKKSHSKVDHIEHTEKHKHSKIFTA